LGLGELANLLSRPVKEEREADVDEISISLRTTGVSKGCKSIEGVAAAILVDKDDGGALVTLRACASGNPPIIRAFNPSSAELGILS